MRNFVCAVGTGITVLAGILVGCGTPSVSQVGPDGGADAGGDTSQADSGANQSSDSTPFVIGGTVTGLLGTGMVLQNNGGDDIAVNANGTFVFPTKLTKGKTFAVTVKNQPTAPKQTCAVTGGTGTVATGNVSTVAVTCATNAFTVGGTISGLAGTGLVLQNNGGDDITVGADGSFAFPTAGKDGTDYAVSVKKQPTNLSQTCAVSNDTGKIAGANVTTVQVKCVTNKFTVGGTVTGLAGSGLVLQNNGGDDLAIAADGTFSFATSQTDGTNFAVTVKTDPTNPEQTCEVTGGTGSLAGGNVSSINVNCSTKKYAIGGTVSGLEGSGLVLQNNAGDDLPINSDGTFAFPTTIDDLASYAVTVKAQPTNKWQTCSVNAGTGNVAAGTVSNVSVTCTTNTYKVKGSVSGLAGTGLVLQNNGGNDLSIAADGSFEFTAPVSSGAGYLVSVSSNPSNKTQTCTVDGGTGTIAGADVENVTVTCVTSTYEVGGTVAGLAAGNSVVLQDNGGDDLTVSADGTFKFGTKLESGATYAVTVKTNPTTPSQTCVVTGDSGTVVAGNIVNVQVNCTTNTYTVGGTTSGLAGSGLVLTDGSGNDVPLNSNGSFAFPAQSDGTTYSVSVKTQPTAPWQTCSVANATGTLDGANVTNVGVSCSTNTYTVGGSITGLTSAGLVLTSNGGNDLSAASGATSFTFSTPVASGASYAIAVKTQPSGNFCSVASGAGTVTSANVTTSQVTCIDYAPTCNALHTASPALGDGLYWIDPDGTGTLPAIQVYCDMTTDGGGWTLVLNSASTPPAVAPNWVNATTSVTTTGTYGTNLSGFNQLVGLQWWNLLGTVLRVETGSSHASPTFKNTYTFSLGSAAQFYKLNLSNQAYLVGSSTPGLFSYHLGMSFSTYDADHDSYGSGSCGTYYNNTPFWYGSCWTGSFWGYGTPSSANVYWGDGAARAYGAMWIR